MRRAKRVKPSTVHSRRLTGLWRSAPIWTSIAAFAVAMVSLLITLRSDAREQKQWMLLNTPRLRIANVGFVPLLTMSEDSARDIDWGYNVFLVPEVGDNRIATGRTRLVSRLSIQNDSSSRKNAVLLTWADVEREISTRDVNSLPLASEIQAWVVLRNDGVLPVELTGYRLVSLETGGDSIMQQGSVPIIGESELKINFSFFLNPSRAIPDSLPISLEFDFRALNRPMQLRSGITYFKSSARWRIDEANFIELR